MSIRDALNLRLRTWLRLLYDDPRRYTRAIETPRPGEDTLGGRGERLAERHLKRSGYRLLTRNFRAAGAEIDLIAADGETIVFVEVKTRVGIAAGRPEEAVDGLKQSRIRRAAEIYLDRHCSTQAPIRFDVVAISGQGANRRVELFKDAF